MAYLKETEWDSFLSPALRLADGDDSPYDSWENDWVDDPTALNPWKDSWTRGVEQKARQQSRKDDALRRLGIEQRSGIEDIVYPTTSNTGWAIADRRAGTRGVNPGKTGGTGQLFELAKSQLGTPYVFGAAGGGAFDCSGFTQWLYKRALGVSLPHQAKQQAQVTQSVGRDELQPGDLIFYSYGRLGSDVDHVEVYMGDGKQIGTSNPTEDLDIDAVDWRNVHSFGRVKGADVGNVAPDPRAPKAEKVVRRTEVRPDSSNAPAMLVDGYKDAGWATVLADMMAGPQEIVEARYKVPKTVSKGPNGSIRRQLYQGFADAGRMDLARMVGTRDFGTWISQESGWNPGITSPANNNGLANDGLFQVWRGHSFNSGGEVSRMSPYEQAQLIAEYFGHLTPEKIRQYAAAIRAGSYSGWG